MGFKYPIESTWLDLCKNTANIGKIPSLIESTHFLRVLQQTTGNARTTYPTNVMRSYLNSTEYILSQVPLNMYKEGTPQAHYEFGNTKLLLKALRTRQAYSSDLRFATNRVGLVTERGICYADEKDRGVSKEKYQLFQRDTQLRCDGLITNTPKTTLISYSADCVLCKLEDSKTGAIGVFHAQWRNLLGVGQVRPTCEDNIIDEIIYRMRVEFGTEPSDLEVLIFPCISKKTFEVQREVARMFRIEELEDCVSEDHELGKYYVDLKRATIKLLMEAGVTLSNIDSTPYTTDSNYFNSHRLSRQAIAGSDLKLLSTEEYELPPVALPVDKEVSKINAQNLLIVKKL